MWTNTWFPKLLFLKKKKCFNKAFRLSLLSSSFLSLEESESIIHYPKKTKLFPKTYITFILNPYFDFVKRIGNFKNFAKKKEKVPNKESP